ncbi:MAG: hypothetical protein H0W45_01565 [Acidobacteria bacterium]|nr:hypothetical protein [Acidobacteriota bacterium]
MVEKRGLRFDRCWMLIDEKQKIFNSTKLS